MIYHIQIEYKMEKAQTENRWSVRNHRPVKPNRTERELEDRNETQTSESREKNTDTYKIRLSSMDIKPDFKSLFIIEL